MRAAVVNGFLNRLRKVGHSFSSQPCLLKITSCQPQNFSEMCSSTNQSEFLSILMGTRTTQLLPLKTEKKVTWSDESSSRCMTLMAGSAFRRKQHDSMHFSCIIIGSIDIVPLCEYHRYPSIVRCSLHDLKEQGILAENIDPLGTLVKCTCGPPDLTDKLRRRYGSYLFTSTLEKMRCAVILDYLSWQLNARLYEICYLMEQYPILTAVSLQNLHRIWTVLTKNFSFNVEIIKNNGFLLTLKASDVLQLLQQFSHLGGLGIKVLALECPRLLTIPSKRLGLSEDILQKFGVTDDQISRCAEIFLLDPAQLHNRLSEIKSIPEMEILQVHPQFLWMVFNNSSFKGKTKKGQNAGIGDVSLSRWCSTPSEILRTHTIKQHDDQPPEQHELEMYLADRLSVPLEKIKTKLMFNMDWTKSSLQKTSELVSFLEQSGFSHEQIFNALPHLLMTHGLQQSLTQVLATLNADQCIESFSQPNGLLDLISTIKEGGKPKDL